MLDDADYLDSINQIIFSEKYDDYLYLAEDLVTLRGRRYNGQRNHINKFKKLYPDYRFEVITEENAHLAKDFCEYYFENAKKKGRLLCTK